MRDVLFVGDILAMMTHEMQNVLAIIKESGSLVDDILALNGPPRMKHGDKLQPALATVQEQVMRGREMMIMLNGLAHAPADFPVSGDIVRFARQICLPAQRMVRLKECSLLPELDIAPLSVRGSALSIMQSIHAAIAAVLTLCGPGSTIRLGISPANGGAVLRVSADTVGQEPDVAKAASLMAELGGTCRAGKGMLELCYLPAGGGEGA